MQTSGEERRCSRTTLRFIYLEFPFFGGLSTCLALFEEVDMKPDRYYSSYRRQMLVFNHAIEDKLVLGDFITLYFTIKKVAALNF